MPSSNPVMKVNILKKLGQYAASKEMCQETARTPEQRKGSDFLGLFFTLSGLLSMPLLPI